MVALIGLVSTRPGTADAALLSSSQQEVCRAWKVVEFPILENGLTTGVSGTSADDVWTVGSYNYAPSEPIIRHWDGTKWRPVPQERVDGSLYAVAAISSTDAWAVGYYGPVLTMHWDGAGWSIVDAPSPGIYHRLTAITAISSDDVWAVGWSTGARRGRGLTLHWDGTNWTELPDAPNPNGVVFYGVAAVSTDNVWAVGYETLGLGDYQPTIEHWDGSEWSLVESPQPPYGSDNQLYDVAAISATDIWAVGQYGTSGTDIYPLLEHWDGINWSIVDTSLGPGTLSGVSALSSADVWAVGYSIGHAGTRPLSLHWDGQTWSEVATPHPGSTGGLYAVDAISQEVIWAAGSYFDPHSGIGSPLSERSKGPC